MNCVICGQADYLLFSRDRIPGVPHSFCELHLGGRMSDEEDYNSEEDADYVPSDGDIGSEEENSGEEEDLSVLADDAGTAGATGPKKGRRKKQNSDLASRKRKGGIKLEGDENNAEEETNGDAENTVLAKKLQEEEAAKKAEKEKKRADDLWSSFLSDVKPAARPPPKAPLASTTATQPTKSPASSGNTTNSTAASGVSSQPATKKITITKVFDFAGEEIKITKEVDVDSKEAKQELKKQEENKQQEEKSSASSIPSSSLPATKPSVVSAVSSGSSILGVKRTAPVGSGLGSVLNKIGKKQKMGTLEKSKMDWDSFKKKEGIEEDLKIHNKGKDGYIERMAFLNRADVRQFEIERDLRLSKSGKR